MSKYASPSVAVFVDGYDLTPALSESISRSTESVTQQTNPFGTTNEAHTPVGMSKGVLSVGGGLFDEAVDALHAGIADSGLGVSRVMCLCDQGQTAGKHFAGFEGLYSQKYEVVDTNGSITKANVTYQVSGKSDDGVIVQASAAKTADWDTTAAPVDAADDASAKHIEIATSSVEAGDTSVITTIHNHNLASGDVVAIFDHTSCTPDINDTAAAQAWTAIGHTVTVISATEFSIPVNVTDGGINGHCVLVNRAGGGAGYQQVTAGSGFTNFVGKIQHSVDGSTWADLVTFADTTTDYHNGQRVATATVTTQVSRYLSFVGNVTGAGSLTVMAGFSRHGM
jgi:hypothetical protein